MVPTARVTLVGFAALLALGGCSTTHEFRVAAVGDSSSEAMSGTAAGGSPGAPLIVAAGNALLGSASQLANFGGGAGTGLVDGTVSAILLTTDQTLVQLSNGSTLLLNGVGGTLGDPVSIDLASGRVLGGPSTLVGANVLSNPMGGQLVTATIGGNSLVGTSGAARNPTTAVRSGTSTVTGVVNGVLGPACC